MSISFKEAKSTLLRRYDSYSRLPALLELKSQMGDSEWLRTLGDIWSVCDNIGLYYAALVESPLGNTESPIKEMMTEAEIQVLAALPDELTIYRGCYEINKNGLSWTLDENQARVFVTLSRYHRPKRSAFAP